MTWQLLLSDDVNSNVTEMKILNVETVFLVPLYDCNNVPPELSGLVFAYHPAAPGLSPKHAIYAFKKMF